MFSKSLKWKELKGLDSKSYVCGHCGHSLASNVGYAADFPNGTTGGKIYICHRCNRPTFFDYEDDRQVPGSLYGTAVKGVPPEVAGLYDEARRCLQVEANTASVLCSRKLLMNIAVHKGADEGQSFVSYVDYLMNQGVPPECRPWVDHIRTIGNDANHKIPYTKRDDAEKLITFLELLLKMFYEFPSRLTAEASAEDSRANAPRSTGSARPVPPPAQGY